MGLFAEIIFDFRFHLKADDFVITTLLNLVSDQITPIILGALHYRALHMVFIRSESEKYEQNVRRICAFLEQRFEFTHVERIVNPYDFEDVLLKMRTIRVESTSVLCNITGGTKLMAIAAFQAMNERGIPSFYIDTDNSRLITFREAKVHAEPISPRLTVDDFVRITGAVISHNQTSWFRNNPHLAALTDVIFRNQAEGQQTSRYLHAVQGKYPSNSLSVSAPFKFSDLNKTTVRPDLPVLQKLSGIGLIKELKLSGNHVSYRHADQTARTMLLNHGLWLEYHVYNTIVQLQKAGVLHMDDMQAGVKLNWDSFGTDENEVTNEIDVMVTRTSKLFCISCKAGAKIRDIAKVLNEIEQYSRRLGGIYYYPALVLTSPPDSGMKKRAAFTRVKLFVLDDNFPEELSNWLQQ